VIRFPRPLETLFARYPLEKAGLLRRRRYDPFSTNAPSSSLPSRSWPGLPQWVESNQQVLAKGSALIRLARIFRKGKTGHGKRKNEVKVEESDVPAWHR